MFNGYVEFLFHSMRLQHFLRLSHSPPCYNFLMRFKKIFPWCAVAVVAAVSFGLMLNASTGDSGTMDELAHIPAAYGYVSWLDYRLNPEHPPLLKALAAAPLLFIKPHFPTGSSAWQKDINGQWTMGTQFLYESGNDANQIIRWARLGPMLLTVFLIFFLYFWAKQILGSVWGLLPAILFGLSPAVLAHGHYVTTDVAAVFGVVFAMYYFLRFLKNPSGWSLFWSGIALGIAQLLKFSAVLLLPYFIFLAVALYFLELRKWRITDAASRLRYYAGRFRQYSKSVVLVFFIGYALVVYPVYFLFTLNYPPAKQTADTEYILGSFGGGPKISIAGCALKRCIADFNIYLTKNSATRPIAQYMLGVLMVAQRSAGGNTGYFLGEVSAVGSRLYFPFVYLAKEPLPVLILVLLALFFSVKNSVKKLIVRKFKFFSVFAEYAGKNFAEFAMVGFVVFYWAYSMRSPLNIGLRHLFPTSPFIYILAAKFWKGWTENVPALSNTSGFAAIKNFLRRFSVISLRYGFVSLVVLWFLAETVTASPYFLSYFNQAAGGVWGGYRYVTDSNYDWGQDLLRLQKWVNERNGNNDNDDDVRKIAVDYFGAGNPKYYLGDQGENWSSAKGNPKGQGIEWLAVSINTLEQAVQKLAPGQARDSKDEYSWLVALRGKQAGLGGVPEPDYRAGTSMFIYKL